MPPRKKETRVPKYFVVTRGNESYFVNNMDEPVERVVVQGGGTFTIDDKEAGTISAPDLCYEDVLPGEAVKIEEYDPIQDSDYLLSISLMVTCLRHGEMRFNIAEKGGFRDYVLLWDNGDTL